MKIIRLISESTGGLFDNTFNEDIVVEPNSSIALHSLTAEIDIEQITITAENDEIKFKMFQGDTEYKVLNAAHGVYNSSSFDNLFTDITIKMNRLMSNRSGEIGFQWQIATQVDTKKVNFCNQAGEYVNPTNKISTKYAYTQASSTAGGVIDRFGGTVGNYDSFLYFKAPNCKGASTLRAQIYRTGFTDGFIVGYTTTPYNSTTTVINPLDIKYGIKCTAVGSNYITILNGIESPTTVQAQVVSTGNTSNDTMSIDIYNGMIEYNIGRAQANPVVNLLTLGDAYNHSADLFPVIIFLGAAGSARLQNVKFSCDPFYVISNAINYEISLTGLPSGGNGQPAIRQLVFNDAELARYLGFKATLYVSDPTNTITNFVSENAFSPADFSDSFVVELQNLNIESYDGLTNKRRNLLHSIVQADVIRNRLTYTAPYPLFLSLNNQHKIVLRRIRARLLREDLSPANLTGYSQISLIINN